MLPSSAAKLRSDRFSLLTWSTDRQDRPRRRRKGAGYSSRGLVYTLCLHRYDGTFQPFQRHPVESSGTHLERRSQCPFQRCKTHPTLISSCLSPKKRGCSSNRAEGTAAPIPRSEHGARAQGKQMCLSVDGVLLTH